MDIRNYKVLRVSTNDDSKTNPEPLVRLGSIRDKRYIPNYTIDPNNVSFIDNSKTIQITDLRIANNLYLYQLRGRQNQNLLKSLGQINLKKIQICDLALNGRVIVYCKKKLGTLDSYLKLYYKNPDSLQGVYLGMKSDEILKSKLTREGYRACSVYMYIILDEANKKKTYYSYYYLDEASLQLKLMFRSEVADFYIKEITGARKGIEAYFFYQGEFVEDIQIRKKIYYFDGVMRGLIN